MTLPVSIAESKMSVGGPIGSRGELIQPIEHLRAKRQQAERVVLEVDLSAPRLQFGGRGETAERG